MSYQDVTKPPFRADHVGIMSSLKGLINWLAHKGQNL